MHSSRTHTDSWGWSHVARRALVKSLGLGWSLRWVTRSSPFADSALLSCRLVSEVRLRNRVTGGHRSGLAIEWSPGIFPGVAFLTKSILGYFLVKFLPVIFIAWPTPLAFPLHSRLTHRHVGIASTIWRKGAFFSWISNCTQHGALRIKVLK